MQKGFHTFDESVRTVNATSYVAIADAADTVFRRPRAITKLHKAFIACHGS